MIGAGACAAAGISALLSLIEIVNARGHWPCLGSLHLVALRMLVDGGAGLVAYPLVVLAFGSLEWFNLAFRILLPGLCGPALLRSQLALLGSGQEETVFGPAVAYRRLQLFFEKQIDYVDAENQVRWTNQKALPKLQTLTPDELLSRAEEYLQSITFGDPKARTGALNYMKKTVKSSVTTDDEKRRTIVLKLMPFGGRRFIRRM